MPAVVPVQDIYDEINLEDSDSDSDDDYVTESEWEDEEDRAEPPFTGTLNGAQGQSSTDSQDDRQPRAQTDGVMGYGDVDSGPEASIPPFRPENPPGIMLPEERTRQNGDDYLTPGSFFKLFFTKELMSMLCLYTNTYFELQARNKPSLARNWKALTPDELYTFFSLLMYMSLVQVSRIDLYWSTKLLYHGLWGRAFMSKFRYKQIQSFLKVSNPDTEKKEDKITKVRFLVDYIRRKCMKLYQPHKQISIDERMVANKGRYSFRQYIKDKPTKWGMKIWVLADSITGYTFNFDVYLGRGENSKLGLGYDVVMNLCKSLFKQGYRLFLDNFYTSYALFVNLFKEGIVACGTIMSTRKGVPAELKNVKEFNRASERGGMRCMRKENVGFIQWKDNKLVTMITTMHTKLTDRVFCTRRMKKDGQFRRVNVSQPIAISDYNKFMGGVDRSDQMISKYKVLRRTTKFWKTLMYHMLDVARVNAFIMFQEFRKQKKNENRPELFRPNDYSQLDFTIELIKELANLDENMSVPLYKKKRESGVNPHIVVPVPSETRGNCSRCYREENVERKSCFKCKTCNKHFCFNKNRNCLLEEHPMTDNL